MPLSVSKTKKVSPDPLQAGHELLAKVRAGFVRQGTSLNAWCERENLIRQNVRKCLLGEWNGPVARKLRQKVIDAARIGLSEAA